jgi:hypothetical protein
MAEFIERFRSIREDMWTKKPREIAEALDKSKGYTDSWGSSFFPTLYAWEESVASRNAFVVLRKSLLEGSADLSALKPITKNFLDLYVSYFKMTNLRDTTSLLQEAAQELAKIDSKAQFQELLEELIRYTGRLHYWIEPIMPWGEIVQTFEAATGDRV